MNNKVNSFKKVIDLLEQKKELLVELLNLSQYHEEFCREERFNKLNRLIKSQSLRIDKLKKLDKKIDSISSGKKELAKLTKLFNPSAQDISSFTAQKEEIDSLLLELYKIDQKNQEIVSDKYQSLKKKVLDINHAKRVRNVYIKKLGKTCGFFVDRREKLRLKKG